MGKKRIKPNYRRKALQLPDLDHCRLVLNRLTSPRSCRVYEWSAICSFRRIPPVTRITLRRDHCHGLRHPFVL